VHSALGLVSDLGNHLQGDFIIDRIEIRKPMSDQEPPFLLVE